MVMDTEEQTDTGPDDEMAEGDPAPAHQDAVAGKAPETVNLAATLGQTDLDKYSARVIKDFDRDWKSSEKYREHRAEVLKLFLGMTPASEDGLGNAQVHYPLIAKAVQRIHARIYDQQFPSNGEFFGAKPTDALDLSRAVRVPKHMNWQLEHKVPEYVPNHDANIMSWLLNGSTFTYMYWDPEGNRPCHEVLGTDDVVLPYMHRRGKMDPSLATCPRITKICRYSRHEIESYADSGYFVNTDEVLDKDKQPSQPDDSQKSNSMQEVVDRAAGVEKPETDRDDDAAIVFYEQHRWLRLPQEKRDRPVIVVVHRDTKTVVRLVYREDEDPEDRARYNREKAVNDQAYANALVQYETDLAAYSAGQTQAPTMTPPPMPGEQTMTAPPMPGATTSTGPLMPPPQPPPLPPEPAPVKMVTINFFTHYVCIPNPEGIYGFGVGMMLEGNNIVADTIASQILDAGTLANTVTGLYSRQAKVGRGELRIRPGEFVQTDLAPQDVEKGIHILKFPGADPALAQFIKDQKEEAEELSGASDILSGEVGGSNETATTTQIRISQALAAISILNKRYTRARTEEGRKLARLNSVYIDDTEYFTVTDPFKAMPDGQPGATQMHVARMDYLQDVDITITADPRMASQPQRFQEAMQALQVTAQIAPMVPAIQMNAPLWMELVKNVYTAMDRPELVARLMTPPPMPPPGAVPPGPPGPPAKAPSKGGPPKGPSNGPPHPQPPGPTVPNAGPTPANGPQMGQGA